MDTLTLKADSAYTEDSLKYLSYQVRVTFFCIFVLICSVSIVGNVSAIFTTFQRKHRFIQKTCVISLAVSDLLVTLSGAVNNLESFSHPLIDWKLGQFMCSFLPASQMTGVLSSSIALTTIALDRYRNIVHAINKRWNPEPMFCLLVTSLVWIACAAVSYPLWILFEFKQTTVVYFNGTVPVSSEVLYFCIATKKKELMAYHISTTIIIFVPLIFTFLWLYYKVARLIWRHRKPLSSIFHKKEENSTTETSITHLKVTDGNTTNTGGTFEMHLKKLNGNKKNIHAEKKIQTFRIIIVLIVIYVLLRLPYHIFNILKVVGTYNEPVHWVITYLLTGFVLLNCALNPFLYTFLKSTIRVFSKVHRIFISDFLCKVCCCCCTNAEFEEFERENPFTVDTFDKRSGPSGLSSFKSNSDKRNSRVKFNENLEKCEEGKKDRKY